MKLFFKFLISIISLPFLIPWYLADVAFEYFLQPVIFKKYKLPITRKQVWSMRLVKIVPPVLLAFYLIKKTAQFFQAAGGLLSGFKNIKYLFVTYYNSLIKLLNFIVTPINHLVFYVRGGDIRFGDFVVSLYFCIVPILFIVNLIYRSIKTYSSINKAVSLRNKAIRDVDIVRFAEAAKEDEIFLGLDLNKNRQPFYVKRNWLKGHVQVIGGPGSGKTESIIQPIWFQEMRRNVATFVIDGKASSRNIDKFFTIASSLAQAQDILYFNPMEPDRSATYNPLLRGNASEVKNKIMASINWNDYSPASREKLDSTLNVFLKAMEETKTHFNLRELLEYFQSRGFVGKQSDRVSNYYVKNSLKEILMNYTGFQSSVSFFIGILQELFQTGYGQLLNSVSPQIDIYKIYHDHKDCYFTLPMQSHETATRFLGQLILQDISHCFRQIAMENGESANKEGLLVIDEMAKFASPGFIKLLEASRGVGVSVCYTNQSMGELESPELNLSRVFIDQLTEQTNVVCCFQLGSPESIQMMLDRIGTAQAAGDETKNEFAISDPELFKQLEVGRSVIFIRRPRFLSILKTGYFKFDELLKFAGKKSEKQADK